MARIVERRLLDSGSAVMVLSCAPERRVALLVTLPPVSTERVQIQWIDCPGFGFKPPALAGKGFSPRLG
ncbi:MAG: hypothetical protein KGL48_09575 [Sphingomonadales bacterium]|nr:hypothetical protein [Sphingomonadales bacterium]MDE2570026.1 hypothetical protein [Sphingomonadales bacterium]